MLETIKKSIQLCEKHNIKINIVDYWPSHILEYEGQNEDVSKIYFSPAGNCCIDWDQKKIWYEKVWQDKLSPIKIIHELVHILIDINPIDIDELDSGFLALEHKFATELELLDMWDVWMENVTLDPVDVFEAWDKKFTHTVLWKEVSNKMQKQILDHNYKIAAETGLLRC